MDLTTRKYKFIEQFMKIVNAEKLEQFEALLHAETSNEKGIVAYSIKGKPLTKADIIENNKEAIKSIDKGDFKTHAQMRQKYARQ